jgi:RNA polymerase-interacting CarD/CdnL/TRCF family regulator
MAENSKPFSTGDWVSHLYHGVGQVEGIEEKTLGGESLEYYKVKTRNGVYWIPTDNVESDRIRPVASDKKLKKAISILKSPPEEMDSKHTTRKSRIAQVTKEGDLVGFCALLRDLQAKRVSDKLNTTEQRAHRRLKKKIASEWSATREIPLQEANKKLNNILRNIEAPEKKKQGKKAKAK